MTAPRPEPLDRVQRGLRQLGPGLITGAADDDPSGIATYSQAGAQYGLNMLWTVVLALPLMVAIQMVSARIGYVTGRGLSENMRAAYPRWVVQVCVGLLVMANTLNLSADIAAMGEALRLLVGGSAHIYAVTFGLLCLVLQVFLPYERYVRWLKWLTLSLFAYVAVVLTLNIDWLAVARAVVWPQLAWGREAFLLIVAVLGTTISPYLFFWQASQEVEDKKPGVHSAEEVRFHLARIRTDTVIGMLKVEKLELLDLNVSTVENFRALSSWIGTAYAKAVGLAAHAVEREYTAGRDVMPQRYLVPEQYFLISLARRQGFDISAASIQLTNPEQVPADRRALLPAAISSAVRLALGSSSLPFESQASGHGFMVLMPGMGYRGAQAAAERLEASLTTQLKEYAPEARFDIGVQSIYQHDRRGADDEPTDA